MTARFARQNERTEREAGASLSVLPADSYIAKEFIYPYLDQNAYSWMVLGISLLALHNMGNWHLVAGAVLVAVERTNKHLRRPFGSGVSGIFSQISGYLVAAQMFKNPSLLTRIWSYFLVLQNLSFLVVDKVMMGGSLNIAHFEGHFVNFVIGFILGWVILTKVGVKVHNI